MKNILGGLWHGNISPQEYCRNNTPEMKQLMDYMARHHDDLLKTLSDEQRDVFWAVRWLLERICESCGRSNIRICVSTWGASNPRCFARRRWINAPFPLSVVHCINERVITQKRFHSRYNFGYGILLYMRKMPCFCPLTAHFGGFKGVFSYSNNNSAFHCPVGTEVTDFVSFKGSIVQEMNLQKILFFLLSCDII